MSRTFALMLHSHIPYCRKSGVWPAGEEWLFEAMNETYLPLLAALRRLVHDRVRPAIMIGIVPILMEQLASPYMQDRFCEYLQSWIARARADLDRFPADDRRRNVASYWLQNLLSNQQLFEHELNKDLLAAFRLLQDEGQIEVLSSAATHGLLPLLSTESSVFAQVHLGVETYRKHFRRPPKGFWLPECGYRPEEQAAGANPRRSIDAWLADEGIRYFFVESSAITNGKITDSANEVPTTLRGYRLPSGVAAFGRDPGTCRQVWSAARGYPGDPYYLEFHAKDPESGLRYWRVTRETTKEIYDPALADERVHEHARHFASLIDRQLQCAVDNGVASPVVVNPYDCELFGHWWHEGVMWLEALCRELQKSETIEMATLGEVLDRQSELLPTIQMEASTWGENSDFSVWRNPEHGWVWPYLDDCGSAMQTLVDAVTQPPRPVNDRMGRILRQLGRELLLMQGSDWPFLLHTEQAKEYANQRFHHHHQRFLRLLWAAKAPTEENRLTESELDNIEDLDNPWTDLDWRVFGSSYPDAIVTSER